MKRIVLLFVLGLGFLKSEAQIDVSANPISLLFSNFDVALEYRLKEDFGIELTPSLDFDKYSVNEVEYKNTGFGARLIGKYYFNPNKGCDKWNIGPYIKYGQATGKGTDKSTNSSYEVNRTRFSVGFYTGYKWVSRKNIVFEIGFGIGRAFVNKYESDDSTLDLGDFPVLNIDATGKLALGYRFGGEKSEGSNSKRRK